MMDSMEAGQKTVTSPAPPRSAPRAVRTAAPDFPREPAMTARRPKSALCESTARGGSHPRTSAASATARDSRPAGSARRGIPMSWTTIRPQNPRAGQKTWACLSAAKATVSVALTEGPSNCPVSADRPDGRSAATTGRPAELIEKTARAALPERALVNPVPKRASTTASDAVSRRPKAAITPRRDSGVSSNPASRAREAFSAASPR